MRRRIMLVGGPPLFILAAFLGSWLSLGRSVPEEVLGNVEIAGVDIGGMTGEEVRDVLAQVSDRLLANPLVVSTSKGDLAIDLEAIDFEVDQEATIEAALRAGRDGPAVLDPVRWLQRTIAPTQVPVLVRFDRAALTPLVTAGDPTGRTEPVEPTVGTQAGSLMAVPGIPGVGIDPQEVAGDLAAAARRGRGPIRVWARARTIPTRFSIADARALLAEAGDLTARPATILVGDAAAAVPPEQLRAWLTARPTTGASSAEPAGSTRLELAVDRDRLVTGVIELVGDVGAPASDATLEVRDAGLELVPGAPGTRCCSAEAADILLAGLAGGRLQPISLPLDVREPSRTNSELSSLGIKEKIGEFTTRHAAGESRVVNIHRIADLVRGHVIEPGATFSVNDFVGRRTTANGFVQGGVIENGVFTTSVGGGISQFATTLFNAAFFAGLDFVSYQSHSIYISRYPYGREATLSFPTPDLVLRNTTPYGVLIWTEHTGSSITVSLWSTRYATGTQTGQTATPNGRCTRVRTERTRTFVDGRTEVDAVLANYRPAEGVAC